jgi:hypothetical protein
MIWQFQTPPKLNPYFTSGQNLQGYPLGVLIHANQEDWNDPKPVLLRKAYENYCVTTKSASSDLPILSFSDYQKQVSKTIAPLQSKSWLPNYMPILDRAYRGVKHKTFRNYFLKGAIPLVALMLGLAAAVRRKGRLGWIPFLPIVFVILTIAMAMPAPDFRYAFSFVYSVPFLFWYGKLGEKSAPKDVIK